MTTAKTSVVVDRRKGAMSDCLELAGEQNSVMGKGHHNKKAQEKCNG